MPCLSCIKHKTLDNCDYSTEVIASTPNAAFADKINIFRMSDGPSELKTSRRRQTFSQQSSTVLPWNESQGYQGSPQASSGSSFVNTNLSVSSGSGVISELQMLKLKVHQLEAVILNDRESDRSRKKSAGNNRLDEASVNEQKQNAPNNNIFAAPEQNDSQLPPNGSTYVGVNPYDLEDPDDVLDLYEGYNPIQMIQNRQMNYGPYSWLSIMKKDKALLILMNYFKQWGQNYYKTTVPVLPKDATASKRPSLNQQNHDEEFTQKALARDGHYDQAPLTDKNGSINEMKIKMNQNALSLGLTFFEGELDQRVHLLEKIKLLLPNKMTLWVLINRFFLYIYPFIPLIDESWFRGEIERLLGHEEYKEEKYRKIKADKRLDLAIFGILFIVLRLSYLSTFSNNKADNDRALASSDDSPLAETKYILTHPIDMDVINLAQICLDQFDLYRRTDLVVLQCAVFMRIYHLFSPEEGDGSDGGNSHVFNSMCLQIAFSMGLNREPTKFESLREDEKKNNIGRKIWFFLKLMDMNHSFQYGFPLVVDDNYNDVLVPYYRPGNSNVLDANMERAICETLHLADILNTQIREILLHSLSIKENMKMKELTSMISDLETLLRARFGDLSNFTNGRVSPDDYPFKKVLACKAYLNAKSFLVTLFYHFFLNYEKKGQANLAFFYLRKYLIISCGEFLTEYLLLIGNNHANFDPKSTTPDLILSPSIEQLIHKTNQMNFSILVRLNHSIAKMKQNLEAHSRNLLISFEYKLRYARLCKLSKMIEKFCKFGTSCLSRLSNRYYYAWRISKAHSHTIELINKPEFRDFLRESDPKFLTLSPDQINELLLIADSTLWKIKSSFKMDVLVNDGTTPNVSDEKVFNHDVDIKRSNTEGDIRPSKQTKTSQNTSGFTKAEGTNESVNVERPNISPSSTLSLDFDDFQRDSTEIDMVWRQLTSINQLMEAQSKQELPEEDHNPFTEWIPLYLTNFQPLTPQDGQENVDDAYDFFRTFPYA
ncbi:CIC11C00000001494 [Sungouiella intermedia]|uniref:CIC11C00000001494 n=1 Tax=Sungouiella intermedia TaxID=45354 RepID=A0A1L0D953_9ASCO|nr:CIC11C00000001494 [[Candida] intermedia]